jgi:hypothetical protein
MKELQISIAMATFNGGVYLRDQLKSFLDQTVLPDELVVCDDASKDETVAILKEFGKTTAINVRLFENSKTIGFTRNFEQAIRHCTGDLIFFCDQDDFWFPEKIEVILRLFEERRGKLLLVHDGDLVNERLEGKGVTMRRQVRAGWGTDEGLITGALTVMHKAFRPFVLPFPAGVVGHDVWIHLLARFLGTRHVVNKSLQLIRRHTANTSAWVASSTSHINRATVLIEHFRTPIASSYHDRHLINTALSERLTSILGSSSHPFSSDQIRESLSYLAAERAALHRRDALVQRSFLGRKMAALHMVIRSEYRYFTGLSSFMRDIAR